MLVVSAFRPMPRISDNRNSGASNFRQSQFQSKYDSVSFTSCTSELTKVLDAQMEELVKETLAKNSDVLGENFAKRFLIPLKKLFQENNISIETKNVGDDKICVHERDLELKRNFFGTVHNNFSAVPKSDKDGMANIWYTQHINENLAVLSMFKKLLNNFNDTRGHNTLRIHKVVVPNDLIETTNKISSAYKVFYDEWASTGCDDINLKAQRLQKAVEKLMPKSESA